MPNGGIAIRHKIYRSLISWLVDQQTQRTDSGLACADIPVAELKVMSAHLYAFSLHLTVSKQTKLP